jgi:hypothetical protein
MIRPRFKTNFTQKEKDCCYVCLDEDDMNPLILPCLCKTMFVHEKCFFMSIEMNNDRICPRCYYEYRWKYKTWNEFFWGGQDGKIFFGVLYTIAFILSCFQVTCCTFISTVVFIQSRYPSKGNIFQHAFLSFTAVALLGWNDVLGVSFLQTIISFCVLVGYLFLFFIRKKYSSEPVMFQLRLRYHLR